MLIIILHDGIFAITDIVLAYGGWSHLKNNCDY